MDQQTLKALLTYDQEEGIFRWAISRPPKKAGSLAGCKNYHGYIVIRLNDRLMYAHRLAWLYTYGQWPQMHLDHIDRDKGNNRIANLREATRSQNLFNRKKGNSQSGLPGAYWFGPAKRWLSQIQIDGKAVYLGYFDTADDAHAAYKKAAIEHFGEFARFD